MHMLICNTKLRSSILVFSSIFCFLMMLFQFETEMFPDGSTVLSNEGNSKRPSQDG